MVPSLSTVTAGSPRLRCGSLGTPAVNCRPRSTVGNAAATAGWPAVDSAMYSTGFPAQVVGFSVIELARETAS